MKNKKKAYLISFFLYDILSLQRKKGLNISFDTKRKDDNMLKKYKAYLFMLPIFIIGFVVILFATKNKTNETILAYDTNEIIEK